MTPDPTAAAGLYFGGGPPLCSRRPYHGRARCAGGSPGMPRWIYDATGVPGHQLPRGCHARVHDQGQRRQFRRRGRTPLHRDRPRQGARRVDRETASAPARGDRERRRVLHRHRDLGQYRGRGVVRRARHRRRGEQQHRLPARGPRGHALRRGHPVHRGRTQQLWQVVITDEQSRVVARGQVRLQNLAKTD